jgi:hypothetical protein
MQLTRTLRCSFKIFVAQNGVFHYVFFKNIKNLEVLYPHVFFMLPCSIFMTVEGPLNLYDPYGFFLGHS